MIRRAIPVIICGLLFAPTAIAAGWTVAAAKTVSAGQYGGGTILETTVQHPHALAVRLIHATADVTLLCQSASSSSEWSAHFGAGWHVLPHVATKRACTVSVNMSGTGNLTTKILKK